MKILIVNEKCGYFGGVEQNIADTVAGLRARGHRCYLAYTETTGRNVAGYQSLFDHCFRLSFVAGPSSLVQEPADDNIQKTNDDGQSPEDTFSFSEVLSLISPDVVYLHKVSDISFCLPYMKDFRMVRMVHDHDLCCPRRHKYFALSGRVCNHRADWRCYADGAFLARGAGGIQIVSIESKLKEMRRNYGFDALLVGSRYMREELLQNDFPQERVHVLPPVVRMREVIERETPEEKRVLYVGQLIRGKGVDLLLEALAKMKCSFKATIIGTGNAEEELKAMSARLGLSDRVEFHGWVSRDQLGEFYSAAKVVAVPSRWPEPFGMIGLEAMHHHRAVVGFDVGGIPDWLEHEVTGLIVGEQDTDGFARALERVLEDTSLAARMGRAASERARKSFSFEGYLDRLEAHLCPIEEWRRAEEFAEVKR